MTKPNAAGPARDQLETVEVKLANARFAEARVAAEAVKQAAIGAAMVLPMPQHLEAIRAAEKQYHEALAAAAQATGLVDPTPYLYAADHPHN